MSSRPALLSVMVADDEPLARQYLEQLLSDFDDIALIGVHKNGRELLKACRENPPSLLILDIEMPGLSGFDVVSELQSDDMPMVIFATAFDSYAVEAFELNAVDYLLKPFAQDRFRKAIDRVRGQSVPDPSAKGRLISASRQIRQVSEDPVESGGELNHADRLAIRDGREIQLINIADIDWIDAAGDYMCVHIAGKTHIMRSTMKELVERLPEEIFVRVHRSTIVNLRRVTSVSTLSKGEFRLYLGPDVSLKVSRNYRKSIASLLK